VVAARRRSGQGQLRLHNDDLAVGWDGGAAGVDARLAVGGRRMAVAVEYWRPLAGTSECAGVSSRAVGPEPGGCFIAAFALCVE
jgi:hypothetical protein